MSAPKNRQKALKRVARAQLSGKNSANSGQPESDTAL